MLAVKVKIVPGKGPMKEYGIRQTVKSEIVEIDFQKYLKGSLSNFLQVSSHIEWILGQLERQKGNGDQIQDQGNGDQGQGIRENPKKYPSSPDSLFQPGTAIKDQEKPQRYTPSQDGWANEDQDKDQDKVQERSKEEPEIDLTE